MNRATSTDTTATARIEKLNKDLASCRPYAAFKAICGTYGHSWSSDADIARFEAAAGLVCHYPVVAEELDRNNFSSARLSWIFCTKELLAGRLQFLSDFPLVRGEEAEYFDVDDELEPADYEAAAALDAWERETNPNYHPDIHGYHSQLDSIREGRS